MKNILSILIGLFIIFSPWEGSCQEESTDVLKEANKLKTTLQSDIFDWGGNLNMDMRLNSISGIERRADPFDFRLNGVIFASIYGVKTALNINLADGKVVRRIDRPDIKLPSYAFLGMSPSYKWAKLHLGYRNLTFSPYTLNGTNFYGAGVELKPGNFRLKTFYGRLQRARPENASIPSSIDPTFFRTGWGVQTGYQKDQDEIYLILFSAMDDANSIVQPIERADIRPMANIISSIKGKKSISKNIYIDFDYAWSGLTRDINAPLSNSENISPIYSYGGLYDVRNSTGFHKALKTGINLSIQKWKWDLRHERVDPGYQSLGALFFNNDFENVTLGLQKSFLKQKLLINARAGLERNNLSRTENNSLRRLVGQFSANYRASQTLSFNLNASNFSSTNILRVGQLPIPDNDSLILTQVNRNIQFNTNYIHGKNKQFIWNGLISYQQFNTITNDIVDKNAQVHNIMFSISNLARLNPESSLTNSVMMNHNINILSGFTNATITHAYNRFFMKKKISASFQLGNTFLYDANGFSRHLIHTGINGKYKITDKTNLGVLLTYVNQTNSVLNSGKINEINCRMRFSTKI